MKGKLTRHTDQKGIRQTTGCVAYQFEFPVT
jgi:hypothetical protein